MLPEEYQDTTLKIMALISIVNFIFAYKSGKFVFFVKYIKI